MNLAGSRLLTARSPARRQPALCPRFLELTAPFFGVIYQLPLITAKVSLPLSPSAAFSLVKLHGLLFAAELPSQRRCYDYIFFLLGPFFSPFLIFTLFSSPLKCFLIRRCMGSGLGVIFAGRVPLGTVSLQLSEHRPRGSGVGPF